MLQTGSVKGLDTSSVFSLGRSWPQQPEQSGSSAEHRQGPFWATYAGELCSFCLTAAAAAATTKAWCQNSNWHVFCDSNKSGARPCLQTSAGVAYHVWQTSARVEHYVWQTSAGVELYVWQTSARVEHHVWKTSASWCWFWRQRDAAHLR